MANLEEPEQSELNRIERWLLTRYATPDPSPELAERVMRQLFTPRELDAEQLALWWSRGGRRSPDGTLPLRTPRGPEPSKGSG